MVKASKRKATRTVKVHHAMTTPEDERRALRARVRTQKEIQRLTAQLAREVRRSDYKLLDLGGTLVGRAATRQVDTDAVARALGITKDARAADQEL